MISPARSSRRAISSLGLMMAWLLPLFASGCDSLAIGTGAAEAGLGFFEYVIVLCGILVVVILVGGVLAMVARRKYRTPDNASTIGFTLQDLRRMHERGELSLEEFENARSTMLGNVRGTESPGASRSESRVSGRIPPPRSN